MIPSLGPFRAVRLGWVLRRNDEGPLRAWVILFHAGTLSRFPLFGSVLLY